MRWLLFVLLSFIAVVPPAEAYRKSKALDFFPAHEIEKARPKPAALSFMRTRDNYVFRFKEASVSTQIEAYAPHVREYIEEFNRIVGRRVLYEAKNPYIKVMVHPSKDPYLGMYGLTVYEDLASDRPEVLVQVSRWLSWPELVRSTIWHEMTHAMGFNHARSDQSIMAPSQTAIPLTDFTPDEKRDIWFLYNYRR